MSVMVYRSSRTGLRVVWRVMRVGSSKVAHEATEHRSVGVFVPGWEGCIVFNHPLQQQPRIERCRGGRC